MFDLEEGGGEKNEGHAELFSFLFSLLLSTILSYLTLSLPHYHTVLRRPFSSFPFHLPLPFANPPLTLSPHHHLPTRHTFPTSPTPSESFLLVLPSGDFDSGKLHSS